jgi:hypothetical protein
MRATRSCIRSSRSSSQVYHNRGRTYARPCMDTASYSHCDEQAEYQQYRDDEGCGAYGGFNRAGGSYLPALIISWFFLNLVSANTCRRPPMATRNTPIISERWIVVVGADEKTRLSEAETSPLRIQGLLRRVPSLPMRDTSFRSPCDRSLCPNLLLKTLFQLVTHRLSVKYLGRTLERLLPRRELFRGGAPDRLQSSRY